MKDIDQVPYTPYTKTQETLKCTPWYDFLGVGVSYRLSIQIGREYQET